MKHWKRDLALLAVLLATGAPLYALSLADFALFHLLIGMFTTLAGGLIFTVSTLAQRFVRTAFLTQLGPGFLAASLVTFLHLAASPDIGILGEGGVDLGMQLWTIQSILLAVSVFLAVLVRRSKDGHGRRMLGYLSFAAVGSVLALTRVLPAFAQPGQGPLGIALTGFGVSFEYLIVFLYLCAMALLATWKRGADETMRQSMLGASVLFLLAEILYTFAADPTGFFGFGAHFVRLIGFALLFRSIVVEGIRKPYETVFAELNDLSATDGLTGLSNYRRFRERLGQLCEDAERTGKGLYLLVFDIDFFKAINDAHGHALGDRVLQEVARILRDCVRDTDVACRQGGDEFSVLLFDVPEAAAGGIVDRFRRAFAQPEVTDERIRLTVSGGAVRFGGGDPQALLVEADRLLYAAKNDGRNRIYLTRAEQGGETAAEALESA